MPLTQTANKMEFTLEHRRYRLAFTVPVRTAHGPWPVRQGLYVRAVNPDGVEGFGEAAPVPHLGGETTDDDVAFLESLGGRVDESVLGWVPAELGALRNALSCAFGRPHAVAAHPSLGVAALLPAGRAALDRAPVLAEAGYRVFKWKVAVHPAPDEMAILDDILARLPSGSVLRLDANGGWDRRTAESWLTLAAERPVEFVEQPLPRNLPNLEDFLLGLARDYYPVPIALDESVSTDADALHWLERGWPGVFVVKPALLGDAAGVLSRLSKANALVVFSSALETAVGAQAALRHAFAWPGKRMALGFGVWPLFTPGLYDGPQAGPFIEAADVERIDPSIPWNATNSPAS